MANSLGIDLRGRVVILKESAMDPEYKELKWRRFHVVGGFGASATNAGTTLIGIFLEDEETKLMKGYDVERLATDQEMEEWAAEMDHIFYPTSPLERVQQALDKEDD